MPEDKTENEPVETVAGQEPSDEQKQDETAPGSEQAGSESEQKPENEQSTDESKLSHEDALAALKQTRGEAANWRTKVRELESKLAEAKTPEQIEALVNEMKVEREQAEAALVVENVALRHKLPDDLKVVLEAAARGKSREELEQHAKALAKYAPTGDEEDPELQGGLRPGSSDDSFDPVAVSRAARARR